MNDTLDQTAQRIANQGRDALLARLRPAFEEAAAAHADVLELSPEQIEQMVQQAADRADGLQWRRALAAVATEELGIGLGEALSHPAVERAQVIVGAPSYEESLAKLGPITQRSPEREAEPEPATDEELEGEEEPEGREEREPAEAEASEDEGAAPTKPAPSEPGELRLPAVHLGGIANLGPAEPDIELRFSDSGLDIVRGSDSILGRLTWPEVTALEVPEPHGWRRRRRSREAQLVLRTEHGDASFQIPEMTAEQLREQLGPLRQYM